MTNPSGILSTPIDALADLIAGSTTFQAWVGAPDSPTAKLRVYVSARSASGAEAYVRPFALVIVPDGFTMNIMTGHFASGELKVLFEANTVTGHDHTDSTYDFANQIGQILDDVMVASYAPGALLISGISMVTPPQRADLIEEGGQDDYFQCMVSVKYGLSS
jgi:hypothetical protein